MTDDKEQTTQNNNEQTWTIEPKRPRGRPRTRPPKPKKEPVEKPTTITTTARVNGVLPANATLLKAPDDMGDNARILHNARVALTLPRIDTSDPKAVEQRAFEYLDFCEANDVKPHLVGLASWIGVRRSTLNNWRNYRKNDMVGDVINKFCDIMEVQWADYMQNGKINPAAGIFLGKNWYGYRDEQRVAVVPEDNIDPGDADAAREKYLQNIEGQIESGKLLDDVVAPIENDETSGETDI